MYLFMGILIGSAVLPISLAMFWPRMTGVGMVTGSITGAILGIIVWLTVASTFEGGLSKFLENTGMSGKGCPRILKCNIFKS